MIYLRCYLPTKCELFLWACHEPRMLVMIVTDEKKAPCGAFFLTQLLFDSSRLTLQFTQVVELGLAHISASLDRYAVNQRTVALESTLYANTVRNFAHGKGGAQVSITHADNNTFKGLQAFARAFLYPNLNNYRIARGEFGQLFGHLLFFELGYHTILSTHLNCS